MVTAKVAGKPPVEYEEVDEKVLESMGPKTVLRYVVVKDDATFNIEVTIQENSPYFNELIDCCISIDGGGDDGVVRREGTPKLSIKGKETCENNTPVSMNPYVFGTFGTGTMAFPSPLVLLYADMSFVVETEPDGPHSPRIRPRDDE